jgi:hypothetical protein
MPRALRAYTYELCDSHLPRDVLAALGEPSHIRQCRLVVFARTAKAALDRLIDLGLRSHGASKPKLAYGNDVTALERAEFNTEGSVYVFGEQTRNVSRVHFDDSYVGARTSTLVGELARVNIGSQSEIVPLKETGNV